MSQIWMVILSVEARRGRKAARDIKYVRAATQAGAVKCAKFHSMLPSRCSVFARLATPQDLGCVPSPAAA